MAERRPAADARPIQTSAVIVLSGAPRSPALAPPSPPTPFLSPAAADALCGAPTERFRLARRSLEEEEDEEGEVAAAAAKAAEKATGSDLPAPSEAEDEAPVPSLALTDEAGACRLARGLHVLATEAAALAALVQLYVADGSARHGFDRAVQAVAASQIGGGKLVVVGVGKSGHVARKMVATLQSLAVRAAFLHPTEALHGDLGLVQTTRDALLFITFSGATPELLALLPHLDAALPTVVLTGGDTASCELARRRPGMTVLPAPIPAPEVASFGVSAPSTSTTAALALCDALALTIAAELHVDVPAEFARNHPGGAIGIAAAESAAAAAARADEA